MKKNLLKKTVAGTLCAVILCFSCVSANPGSADDPLITLSYVNDVLLPQIKAYVDSTANTQTGITLPSDTVVEKGDVYNVVNVSKGQILSGGKSCHMIIRAGTATAIGGKGGGIADITDGIDLTTGTVVPLNLEIIIPVNDGRGLKMETDCIVMVKGTYSVGK